MERKTKKFLSLFLAGVLSLSVVATPVYAAPNDSSQQGTEAGTDAAGTSAGESALGEAPEVVSEEKSAPKTITVEENNVTYTVDANNIDVTGINANSAVIANEEAEVDADSPVITTVEAELTEIQVLNDDGQTVALTEEQIQTVLGLYQQYLDQWEANADVLGVQTPFFLQFNDDGEDGLGILGEMLVLAGYTVDDVRNGNYSYDDLIGMIQNFLYADKFGIEFYAAAIREKRDEVMQIVEDSGAETVVQKMLVINDWMAHIDTFDMSYIMNMGQDEPVMVAENPQKHEHYDEIYDEMYALYEDQIRQQFHDQIYAGIVAQLRQQYYEAAIRNIVIEGYKSQVREQVRQQYIDEGHTDEEADAYADEYLEENAEQIDADASAYADQYMEENADAISEDAAGFVEENFGPDVAAQLSAGADEFIEEAETEGVEVDGVKMTVEEITQQQMDQPSEDLDGKSPNDVIPVYADQAATGLTNGIIGAWEGNHIGVLAEGTSVCAGYAKAFAYLLQYMTPEVYGINGADTDMNDAANWKTSADLYYDEEGNLDITKDYIVDLVRITFDADVTMYGETQENFNSDHFWNAVQVDGQWYYVDPCYTDVYTEVMSRDRVEMDGTMNHLYFMFSHSTAAEMYDGNMKEIKSLYSEVATDTRYEESWYSRVSSNAYSDGDYFYYLYDSTDMLDIMREFNSGDEYNADYSKMEEMKNPEYKIVRHEITDADVVEGKDGDSDYEALIEFNYKENEDDDTTVARVYNPATGEMEENELLTKLFAQYKDECAIYPSIKLSTALYHGKLYFNLSNCILSYDLESGSVELVKEYNTVYAQRDDTVAFGGMAFDVVDSAEEADFTVTDHPIASMTIKDDGQMYVSIATNFAYISGKDPHDFADSSSYGYEFEESNYNPDYSRYMDDTDYSDEQLAQMGYTREYNDNDEFMWSAVFVDTLEMDHLAGSSHTYAPVTVDPFCGRDGYTENRCTDCGAIEAGTRETDEGSAEDHHYIHFEEEYYTKDDDGNWRTGDSYVCTVCGYAVESSDDGTSDDWDASKDTYEMAKEKAGHVYTPVSADSVTWGTDEEGNDIATISGEVVCEPCDGRPLDVLQTEETSITVGSVTLTNVTKESSGTCDKGITTIYTATGNTEDGKKLSATKTETTEPGQHSYEGRWTWTEVEDENAEIPYTATATLTCEVCGDIQENVEAVVTLDAGQSVAPTCGEDGKNVYIATATVTDEDGNTIGSATAMKVDVLPATGDHRYDENGICTVCGAEESPLEVPVIQSVYSTDQTSVKVTWSPVDDVDGYELWRTTNPDAEEDEWSLAKTIKGDDVNKYTNAQEGSSEEGSIQYRNTGLEVGQTYYYKVRAFRVGDDGTPRRYSDFSGVDYMPAAVVFDNVYSNSTERVRLLWNEIQGADGYQIWRMNDDGTYSIVKTLGDKDNTLTDDQGATTAYSNTGLEAGKTYTYKMRAFCIPEDGKKVYGAYSDAFTVAVMPEVPDLSGTSRKAGTAKLEWNTVNGAAGYQIWMATSKGGTYTLTKSITDGTATSYTKSDLAEGGTYYFKIRAYTEVDGKKTFGGYSDIVSVKVLED